MSQPAPTPKDVQRAEAGVITTPLLEIVTAQAHAVKHETVTEEGAALLLLCMAPICDELLEYRRRRDGATSLADMTNVVVLRGDQPC